MPEYQGLSEADLQKFETPRDIDSEYQTVMNAYTFPIEWERDWQQSSKAIDLSIGSLSNKLFYHYSRLKVEAPLNDSLNFHFTVFSQRDREVDQVRHVLELSQRVLPKWRINIYGEPSLYKRENDMGVAVLWAPSERWKHRFYYTIHDLTRAEHNDQADRFVSGRDPRSIGWIASGENGPLWLRIGLRYDQPVTWIRPQEARIFSYDKKLAFADAHWSLSDRRRLTARAQWDETFKGQEKDTPASVIVPESWKLSRLFARFAFKKGEAEDRWGFETAITHAQRHWVALNGELTHFNDLVSVAVRFDHWRAEYEMGIFRRFGDLYLAPTQKHSPAEHRLQTAYEWSFRNNAKLILALNFDADQWTPVPTFEGGNGMFRAEF